MPCLPQSRSQWALSMMDSLAQQAMQFGFRTLSFTFNKLNWLSEYRQRLSSSRGINTHRSSYLRPIPTPSHILFYAISRIGHRWFLIGRFGRDAIRYLPMFKSSFGAMKYRLEEIC